MGHPLVGFALAHRSKSSTTVLQGLGEADIDVGQTPLLKVRDVG